MPENKKVFFGRNIKKLRLVKGFSQSQFSKEIGISLQTIKRYEKSNSTPDVELLMRLSDYFDVSAEDLMYHNFGDGEPESPGKRPPSVTDTCFSFFEGQKYFVYYLSEKSDGKLKNGFIEFAEHHDEDRLYLIGTLMMHHSYDCKLVIDDRSAIIYGTGSEVLQRVVIVLHFPDFGEEKSFKYRGGLGLVIHRDTFGHQAAQRICLTHEEIPEADEEGRLKLLQVLTGGGGIERITIKLEMDSNFNQWILNRRQSPGEETNRGSPSEPSEVNEHDLDITQADAHTEGINP